MKFLLVSFFLSAVSMVRGISHNYHRALQAETNIDCDAVESQYSITVIDMSPDPSQTDQRYTEAFQLAANRWSKVIVGDLQPFSSGNVDDWFGGRFAPRSFNGAVDDLVIGFEIPDTIDGPGGTLGSAGSVFVRRDRFGNPGATASGTMTFDGQDLDRMDIEDVKAVVLHEMGHVIGLVGTTGLCNLSCDPDESGVQSTYKCNLANQEYQLVASGTLFLENNGGAGTACGHWEEGSFREGDSSELMTGFFEDNLFQPISRVTVAAVEDLGYEVDYCGADIWPATEETIQLWNVYRSAGTVGTGGTDRIPPDWVIDDVTGEWTPWGESGSAGTNTLGRPTAWLAVATLMLLSYFF